MKPIYTPKGAAKEYGDYAINVYTGCPHRCYYCFAPSVLRPGMPTPPRMPINNDEYEEWIEKGRPGKEKASERIKSEVWHND